MTTAAALGLVRPDHPALRQPAALVDFGDDDRLDAAVDLAIRMEATVRARHGRAAGLAAPQVGHALRIVTVLGEFTGRAGRYRQAVSLANPTVRPFGRVERGREGCLTFPGRWWLVPRAVNARVAGIDLDTGDAVDFAVTDAFAARLWQHELDHLDGRLISDAGYEPAE